MKLRSIISWALIFSLVFLLFQPLIQVKEIEQNNLNAEIARVNNRLKYLADGVENFKNSSKKASLSNLINKANAEEELMLTPEEDLLDTEDSVNEDADETDNTETDSSDSPTTTDDSSENSDIGNAEVVVPNVPDDSEMPDVAILLQTADKVALGATTPISVSFWIKDSSEETIDKINISIQESNGRTSFKDSFINYKDKKQLNFIYTWDTFLAQSVADKSGSKHKVIVEVYQKKDDKFVLYKEPITREIEVVEKTWNGIEKDGFWNNYLNENGSLNDFWLKKLECNSKNDCKTRKQIQDHLAKAAANGNFTLDQSNKISYPNKFNDADATELSDSVVAYKRYLDSQKIENKEEAAKAFFNLTMMTDLISYMDEQIDNQRGFEMPKYSEEILMAPEMMSALKAIDKYQVKLASYDPQTKEELQELPFWPEMGNEVANELSKDPEDKINSMDELRINEEGAVIGGLRPQRAQAIAPLAAAVAVLYVAGIVISGIDLYNAIKSKNAGNIVKASIWMAISLIPAGKLLQGVGWIGKLALGPIGRLLSKITFFAGAGNKLKLLWTALGVKIVDLMAKPGFKGLIGKALYGLFQGAEIVGKWIGMIPGAIKKVLVGAGLLGIAVLRFLGILKSSPWFDSTCPKISITGKGLDPFAWALCNILKFIHDLAFSIWKFSFCLFNNAIGAKETKCEFKYAPN